MKSILQILLILVVSSVSKAYSQGTRVDTYYSSKSFANATEETIFYSENWIMFNYFNNELVSLGIMAKDNLNPNSVLIYKLYDTGVDINGDPGVVHRVYSCAPLNEYTEKYNVITHLSVDTGFKNLMIYDNQGLLGGYVLDWLDTRR